MKSLIHSVYLGGAAGLSNLVMSIELGVVMASLTDRVLVLKGNHFPRANRVDYSGEVSNRYPSRVTDLMDLGVPWLNEENVNLAGYAAQEICGQPAWEAVCSFPGHLSTDTADFRSFAGRRSARVIVGEEQQDIPALAFSGGPDAMTLSFYSSFFYLDRPSQLVAHDALRRMRPKPEIADLANRIARDLGAFNAVHIRRGDFKVTSGVTTLDRTGAEAVAAMDKHFKRNDRLVVLTDEANDPFFDVIRESYDDLVFIDWHILRQYGREFHDLPAHDSIALAYLSQLIAAQSMDFIGTMTSTFTALIQRYRGNSGKEERFKYLWNELPPAGARIEPGRHALGDDVPLDNGVMIEAGSGPYSWNRVNQRFNNGWMREWPESFLDDGAALERSARREYSVGSRRELGPAQASKGDAAEVETHAIGFRGRSLLVKSNDKRLSESIRQLFKTMIVSDAGPGDGELVIEVGDGSARLLLNGAEIGARPGGGALLRPLYREVVRQFIHLHPELVWMHAACAASERGAVILPGSWGSGKTTLALELVKKSYTFLSDDIVPFDPENGTVIPFPATPQVRPQSGASSRDALGSLPKSPFLLDEQQIAASPAHLSLIAFPWFVAGSRAELAPVSPGHMVGKLLENSLSFPANEDATIQKMCDAVASLPAYDLFYDRADEAADLLVGVIA